ncbi:MAG: hypothetical protein HFJ03_06125 [Lachnospira sp.]|jgi:hypothetical protein|nr:hypothetical protein [Lachnospira sp.]
MNQQINEYKKMVIVDILQSSNTLEKVEKFRLYKDKIRNCRIFLFDEESSNFDESLKNKKIGQCGIWGIGDYTKTWILDSKHISERVLVQVGKTIDFDLNILTYLNKIMEGRKINIDKVEFLNYLNYIKKERFQIGITTALMERVQTSVDLCILSEMITSFVKFDNIPLINGNFESIYLSSDDYMRIKQIYDTTLGQIDKRLEQFNLVCCCVMKAFLIKTDDMVLDKSKKVEKFIDYCLNVLNCYLEKEIVILSLYIMDDSRTHKTFKKLKNNSDIIKNILNVTWDIYHIKLIENIMLCDNMKNTERVILSYFGTADNGIIDAMQINPVKAFVIIDDYPVSIHQMNIKDVCKNEELLENGYLNANIRGKKIKELNFGKIREQLESEILDKANS